ncbi:MAG: HNH endonuclease [Gammaproteobacteria bacterium]|nr:HNH endonuclease [Gammaproteobacteria bacterium]NNJ84496.1 HNH endonuclease [Gammaproteobacteria bacterium]
MRIALRTGGGRGVYELAGTQGAYKASDLFNRKLFYELTPDLVIPGRARADQRQGKPRIKLDDQKITTHLYRLIAGILLLPKPKREFRNTGGDVLVSFENYSITAIKIDLSSVSTDKAIVRPTDILLANHDGLEQRIRFVDRMSRILVLWEIAGETDSELGALLQAHRDCVYASKVDFKAVERSAKTLLDHFGTVHDPLKRIEASMGLLADIEEEDSKPIIIGSAFGLDDDNMPQLARIENLKRWRQVSIRGSAAAQFRSKVRAVYNDTCLFTGQRLPKMEITASAGVDAAHILPWSSHNINSVTNGLCINKQCHWALDSGVIRLSYDSPARQYMIDIPEPVKTEATKCGFDLKEYEAIEGPIPKNRLPDSQKLWPSPEYLQTFNKIMFEE